MDRAKVTSLVFKLKEGQKEYFDEFYAQTSAAAFYLAKKYCGASEAEDVMQEAYLSAIALARKKYLRYRRFAARLSSIATATRSRTGRRKFLPS